jgi:hypothetical protein
MWKSVVNFFGETQKDRQNQFVSSEKDSIAPFLPLIPETRNLRKKQ